MFVDICDFVIGVCLDGVCFWVGMLVFEFWCIEFVVIVLVVLVGVFGVVEVVLN